MNEYYISYLLSNIHILGYGYSKYINLKFSHNEKSCLIIRDVHKNKINPDARLLLKLKDKGSIIYSTSLLALKEFNRGKHEYVASTKTAMKILNDVGIKYCGFFSIGLYTDDFYYESYHGKILLKVIKDMLPIICLNF